jgi:hypothetical protein
MIKKKLRIFIAGLPLNNKEISEEPLTSVGIDSLFRLKKIGLHRLEIYRLIDNLLDQIRAER